MSSSESDSESDAADRPNRWTGSSNTWNSLTAQERGLAASLDQIRNRDLSIHLYNAFALKKRALSRSQDPQPSRGQETRSKNGEDADLPADNEGEGWAPPKSWVAWPLPPDLVPREGEHIGPEDEDDAYTFKRREVKRPSGMLEDVLLGVALKQAKERFEARKWAEEVEGTGEADVLKMDSAGPALKDGSHPPKSTNLVPVISADDERSRQLLRSSIRHTISNVDKLLMGLKHTMDTCRQYASYAEATSGDETEARASSRASSVGSRRSRGRPRRFVDLTSRPKVESREKIPAIEAGIMRVKTSRRGRPKKQYPREEGETDWEYTVRIARLQKKPIPTLASSAAEDTPEPPPLPVNLHTPARRNRSTKLEEQRQKKYALAGWDVVIGAAAITGAFSPDVIARATQRCADTFGEGMMMRTLVEAPFNKIEDFETRYEPGEIPDFSSESHTSDEDDDGQSISDAHNIRKRRGSASRPDIYLCIYEGCPRKDQGFESLYHLKRHLTRAHRMTEDEIHEHFEGDSDVEGGIHVDGFLRLIQYPKKSTGKRKYSRKRRSGDGEGSHEASTSGSGIDDDDEESSSSSQSDNAS